MEELNIFTITAAIADPVRLSVMMYLIRGSASVTEMINHLEVSQSNLSNHLAVLKNAGLIKSTSAGRQKIYELSNPDVAQLIELLLNLQPLSPKKEIEIKPIQQARTCYDHLAGKLGVAVFNALMQQGAINFTSDTTPKVKNLLAKTIQLGPNGDTIFGRLGIDLPLPKNGNRKFAFGCMDWTEKTPHLAGALGAAVCQLFLDKKWVARKTGTRAIVITASGKQALKELVGLEFN
ncbi:MAG: winged helix-turn-helix transcriptional regulator [Mucilaginibacter sp.]|uniref:ArsR/SmtB family transcription factor n=1 Tax=Mucilaginibacter sp. TaxID=1882438 RepID=UPI002604E721|nr:metalloregulator ArsR/SmtB family transcription factor [Mucilaginibacter sp.]MDB5001918.1 winged helix-turn-helix transcriptional regulator [Mucilaginibacter sp.]